MAQTIDFLRKVSWFEDLDDKSLQSVVNASVEQSYEAGQDIVREGDSGVGAYIIRSGRAEVLQSQGAQQRRVRELGPGDFFGEMALLDDFPRSSTVRALEPTTCVALTRWHFRGILESHPQIALAILPVLTRRLREAEKAAAAALQH